MNIRSVGAFSSIFDLEDEYIPNVFHVHLYIRGSIHSASVKKVKIVVQFFLSKYLEPGARLLQKVRDLSPVFSRGVLIKLTRFSQSSKQIF